MITKNAENTFILAEFAEILNTQKQMHPPQDWKEFFWRTGPDTAYTLAAEHYQRFPGPFQDTLFDLPVIVELDFPTGTMELRNGFTALVRVTNIGQPKIMTALVVNERVK